MVRVHPRSSGRNSLFLCESRSRSSPVIVKQCLNEGDVGPCAETWFYANLADSLDLAPRALIVDAARRVVATEAVTPIQGNPPGARLDCRELLSALVDAACPLSELHSLAVGEKSSLPAAARLPQLWPVPVATWMWSGPAARELVAELQSKPSLRRAYAQARLSPETGAYIHGDVHLDNLGRSGQSLKLLDWELSGWGAPAADLGAVVGTMLCAWADGLALSPGGSVEEWVAEAEMPFRDLTASVAEFLGTYMGRTTVGRLVTRAALTAHIVGRIVARIWRDAIDQRALGADQRVRLLVAERLLEVDPGVIPEFVR